LPSYVHESVVFFVGEAIYAAAEAIDPALSGGDLSPVREPTWRLSWDTWSID
jgi:hypothetical protein